MGITASAHTPPTAPMLVLSADFDTLAEGRAVLHIREVVRVTVWRTSGELTVPVRTAALSGNDVDRVLVWAGASLTR